MSGVSRTLALLCLSYVCGLTQAEPLRKIPLSEPVLKNPNSFSPAAYCRWQQSPNGEPREQDLSHFSQRASIQVDLSARVFSRSPQTGLFFALKDVSALDPEMIRLLSPRLWTMGSGNVEKMGPVIRGFGATPNMLLTGAWDEEGNPPYVDTQSWFENIRDIVGDANLHFGPMFYEAWNEPDCWYEWSEKKLGKGATATFGNLFKTYEIAYRAVRQTPGGVTAQMAGLAWNLYDRNVFYTFLEYCLEHRLEVNALVWHELGAVKANLPLIRSHLEEARRLFVDNPRYAPLKIRKIVLNETVLKQTKTPQPHSFCKSDENQDQCFYRPGEILATKYFSELGGADFSSVTNYQTDSPDGSLGGRLNPKTRQPLGAWWAEKLYGDLGATRVPCASDNQQIVCFAVPPAGAKPAQILVAYYGMEPSGSAGKILKPITARLQIRGLSGAGYFETRTISETDTTILGDLPVGYVKLVSLANGDVSATLPALSLDQAVLLTPARGTAPVALSFGEVCPAGKTCFYQGAGEKEPISLSCEQGRLSVQSAEYYGDFLHTLSCLAPLKAACAGKAQCHFKFSNSNCSGDPLFGAGKLGKANVVCH